MTAAITRERLYDHQRVVVVALAWGNPAPARGMVHWLVGRQAALLAAEDAHPLLLLGVAKADLVAHG
eukprot:scaffold64866_cov65-Phaeocystis_antarctica.AAC.6